MYELNLLGYAPEYIPVIFDVCGDTGSFKIFNIFMNISSDKHPEFPFTEAEFQYNLFKPEMISLKPDQENFMFGVPGPYAKYKVFTDFSSKYHIIEQHYVSIIHPKSVIARSAIVERAVFVEPGVIISSQTKIGFGVTIKRGSTVGHHNTIGDFCEINPGVTISSHVTLGKGCIIGSGAVIKNGISIGANSFIGMGSVVTNDIPPGVIAYGSPCRVVKETSKPLIS